MRGASATASWLWFGIGTVGVLLAAAAITSRFRRDAGPWGPRAFMLGCVLACFALLAWGMGMLGAYLGKDPTMTTRTESRCSAILAAIGCALVAAGSLAMAATAFAGEILPATTALLAACPAAALAAIMKGGSL